MCDHRIKGGCTCQYSTSSSLSTSQPAQWRARPTVPFSPTQRTLRQFRRAVDQLQLPNLVRAFGPAHVYLFMGLGPRPRCERRYSAPETA